MTLGARAAGWGGGSRPPGDAVQAGGSEIAEGEAVSTEPTPDSARAPDCVLIVDDDAANLQVLRQALDGQGYKLLVAKSGEDALRIAARGRPQLVLLDVMMPGIDGYETCARLKQDAATRDAAVIFLSALEEANDKVRGFEAGAVDFITKPFQREEVLARVETHKCARSRKASS